MTDLQIVLCYTKKLSLYPMVVGSHWIAIMERGTRPGLQFGNSVEDGSEGTV